MTAHTVTKISCNPSALWACNRKHTVDSFFINGNSFFYQWHDFTETITKRSYLLRIPDHCGSYVRTWRTHLDCLHRHLAAPTFLLVSYLLPSFQNGIFHTHSLELQPSTQPVRQTTINRSTAEHTASIHEQVNITASTHATSTILLCHHGQPVITSIKIALTCTAKLTSKVTAITEDQSVSFRLVLHVQHTFANSANFHSRHLWVSILPAYLVYTIWHSTGQHCSSV